VIGEANGNGGYGVFGITDSGFGVRGSAPSGIGVGGSSTTFIGVQGLSNVITHGLEASTKGRTGVPIKFASV
jgi:hypothetical protein